jgi:hypothetical protein
MLKPLNAQCFGDDECQSGFYPSRVTPFSLGGVCRVVSPLNWECRETEQCEQGAFCRPLAPSTGYPGVCQIPSPPGGPCDFSLACRGNQASTGYFRPVTGGGFPDAGVCQAVLSDVGGPCAPRAEGLAGDTGCFADLTCEPSTARCALSPVAGAPCGMPGRRCGLDAYCDELDTCRAKKLVGGSG